ncbi:MAG: tetratricopeptide repeat protein [Bacteroides sp.]|nr:tetratricopeptide repeat protein [Bacteroides sp.]
MTTQKRQNDMPDVDEVLGRSEAFLLKYKNVLLGGLAAIILAVAGTVLYKQYYAAPRAEKAEAALFKGQTYFDQENYELALNGDSLGYTGFLKVAAEFSGTDAGNLANAYAGLCYAHLGDNENAIKMLTAFDGNDQMVSPAILGATGNCYARLGQLDKAASTLLSAADKADNNTLSPIFLMQAADIFLSQGKADEALKAYTKVKEKYFQSFQAMDIDKYIEKAQLMKN